MADIGVERATRPTLCPEFTSSARPGRHAPRRRVATRIALRGLLVAGMAGTAWLLWSGTAHADEGADRGLTNLVGSLAGSTLDCATATSQPTAADVLTTIVASVDRTYAEGRTANSGAVDLTAADLRAADHKAAHCDAVSTSAAARQSAAGTPVPHRSQPVWTPPSSRQSLSARTALPFASGGASSVAAGDRLSRPDSGATQVPGVAAWLSPIGLTVAHDLVDAVDLTRVLGAPMGALVEPVALLADSVLTSLSPVTRPVVGLVSALAWSAGTALRFAGHASYPLTIRSTVDRPVASAVAQPAAASRQSAGTGGAADSRASLVGRHAAGPVGGRASPTDVPAAPQRPLRTPLPPALPGSGLTGTCNSASGSAHHGGCVAVLPTRFATGTVARHRPTLAADVVARPLTALVPTVSPD
jgi:hypothetical protein